MVTSHTPFSGFSVDDPDEAAAFYADVLGLGVDRIGDGFLHLGIGEGRYVLVYPKGDAHEPASFTVLNLPVDDVSVAVRELVGRGVEFIRYEGAPQDEDGVMKGHGPDIAWFTDPSGNILSILAA